MIEVIIKKEDNHFSYLESKGHADSAEYGKDLVCAAVSAVITGGLNNIKDNKSISVNMRKGFVSIKAKKQLSSYDEAVIETIITSLKTIEEENKRFIKIQIL